jgi:uracil phosphoribosyltransferase
MHYQIEHPLLKDKLTRLRDKDTNTKDFRALASEITMLIAYEALKHVELIDYTVETPLTTHKGSKVKNDVILVPILRAGVGMLEGVLNLIPTAKVAFVGMYRDPETKKPVCYYEKFPETVKDPIAFIIDPMLATGGSIVATVDLIKKNGINNIKVISIISVPEGIAKVEEAHPDVEIYTGNIDEYLNDHKYIIPGLGDAGDRLFGTK